MKQTRYEALVFAAVVSTLGPGVIDCGYDRQDDAPGAASGKQSGSTPENPAGAAPSPQAGALSGFEQHQCGDGSATAIQVPNPNGAAVNVVVLGSQNPIVAGQTVTFTVAVAPAVSSLTFPTGKVTLSIDGAPSASALLDRGCAQFTMSTLATGSHAVVATYDGDANYAGKTSRPYLEAVNQAFSKPWQSGIDVTTRGLVGDGVTDNTPAIQALLASIGDAHVKLYFPAGTYLVSDSINLNSVRTISFTGDVDETGKPASTIKADHIATPYNALPEFYANGPKYALFPLIVRDQDVVQFYPDGTPNLNATMPGGSPIHMQNLRLIAPDDPNAMALFAQGFGNSAFENMEVSGYYGIVGWADNFFIQYRNVKFIGHGIPGSVGLVVGQGVVDQCEFTGWGEGLRNIAASVTRSTFQKNGYGMRVGMSAFVGTPHANEPWGGASGMAAFSKLSFTDNDIGIEGGSGDVYYSDITITGSDHSFSGQSKYAMTVAGGNVAYNNVSISGSFSQAALANWLTSGSMYGLQVANSYADAPTWEIWGKIIYDGGNVPSNPLACPAGSSCRVKDVTNVTPIACDSGTMQITGATYYNADGSTTDCTAKLAQACNGQPNCTVNIDRSTCGSTYNGPGEMDWQGKGVPEYGNILVTCSGSSSNTPLPNAMRFHVYPYAMPNAIAEQDDVTPSWTFPSVQPTTADASLLLDVSKHGIDSDWSTDQTTKIQELIDNASNGTTFYFPQGAYKFGQLDFSRLTNFSIVGDGSGENTAPGVTTLNGTIVADYGAEAGSFQIRSLDVWGGIRAANAVLSNIQNVQVGHQIKLSNPFMFSVRGLMANYGTATDPGAMLIVDGGMRATVESMNLGGTYDGIRLAGANHSVFATRCEVAVHGGINLGVTADGTGSAPLINASISGVQGEADVIGINAVSCDHCMVTSFFTLGHSLAGAGPGGVDIPNPYGLYVDHATNSTFAAVGAGGYFFNSSITITGSAQDVLFTAVKGWNATGPVWIVDPSATGLTFNDSTNH